VSIQQVIVDYKPHPGQARVHRSKARFRVVRAGVRWGKTKMAIYECLWYLGKPKAKIWWLAPSWSEVLVAWRMFLEEIPKALIAKINHSEKAVKMVNDAWIWFKSTEDYEHLRAQGLDFVVLDECARMKREVWFECVRPRLSDPDKFGKALFISTPKGMNWFYEVYMMGNIKGGEWESFHFPTWTNPFIDPKEIESARRGMPERLFRQEYGAEFLSDLGSVFRFRRNPNNNKIINIKGELEAPSDEKSYVAGVDFGKRTDFTVVCVLDEYGHLVAFDRFKSVDWPLQVKRVINLVSQYNAELYLDSTGLGDPIYDFILQMYTRVKPYYLSPSKKIALIDNLALMLEQGEITFPEIPELLNELEVFGVETTSSGKHKYSAPKGFHDDCVIALALAAWGLRKGSSLPGFAFLEW